MADLSWLEPQNDFDSLIQTELVFFISDLILIWGFIGLLLLQSLKTHWLEVLTLTGIASVLALHDERIDSGCTLNLPLRCFEQTN